MSVWNQYSTSQREEYIQFLTVYGALTNLFRQKQGDLIPYLDSKFQETVFAKVFNCQNVDIGNTPHDVLSIIGGKRIGIGLKTWMSSKPSFQKVMQLKRFQTEINAIDKNRADELAYRISQIKNERIKSDYVRLGLSEEGNIYHYVTRDKGRFVINECSYPLVDINSLQRFELTQTAFSWSDGSKDYKFTFGDSQIWQKFDSSQGDTIKIKEFDINIIENPFEFLLHAYFDFLDKAKIGVKQNFVEVYLPLYSYGTKEVEEKSGLNAWNAAPKNKNSNTPRPLNEIYIPIPREFHKKHPDFFVPNIFDIEKAQNQFDGHQENKPEVRFRLQLPNGKSIPALITQSNMKGLQSGSNTERDENGKRYGQSALGQWLLVDVLGLKDRVLVTRDWLKKKGTDSVRLWREKDDHSIINIDFAPIGSFEAFMSDEPISIDED